MVEVVNRQRRKKLGIANRRELALRILKVIGKPDASVTIAFVSNAKMRELNHRFRGVNKTTDVLSFPFSNDADSPNLGDIAISVDRAELQASVNGLTFNEEVDQLILHGLLHLCGYDHETDDGEMNRMEFRLRRKLGI